MQLLIIKQILFVSTLGNVWWIVWRMWILMLGGKGLRTNQNTCIIELIMQILKVTKRVTYGNFVHQNCLRNHCHGHTSSGMGCICCWYTWIHSDHKCQLQKLQRIDTTTCNRLIIDYRSSKFSKIVNQVLRFEDRVPRDLHLTIIGYF